MTPWVTRLIIANAVVYLLTLAAPDLTRILMLVPVLVVLRPWTLVAYMFVHGGLMHLTVCFALLQRQSGIVCG